jgi:hypothetical protein
MMAKVSDSGRWLVVPEEDSIVHVAELARVQSACFWEVNGLNSGEFSYNSVVLRCSRGL